MRAVALPHIMKVSMALNQSVVWICISDSSLCANAKVPTKILGRCTLSLNRRSGPPSRFAYFQLYPSMLASEGGCPSNLNS